MGDDDAEARRRARANWEGKVFRSHEEAREHDILYWLAIPKDERASFVWKLSQEIYGSSQATVDTPARRRLRRSVVRIVRRKS